MILIFESVELLEQFLKLLVELFLYLFGLILVVMVLGDLLFSDFLQCFVLLPQLLG